MKRKWFVGLLVILMVIGLTSVALATDDPVPGTSEAGVVPVEVDGNPLSGDGADNHKVDDVEDLKEEDLTGSIDIPCGVELDDLGHDYPDITEKETITVNYVVSEDGKSLSWSSTDKVELVVVKGGNAANLYYYYDSEGNYLGLWNGDTEMWYDSGLQSPQMTNPKGKLITPEISNFGFFAGCPEDNGDDNGDDNGNGIKPPPTNGGTKPPAYIIPYLPTKAVTATPLALPQTSGNFGFLMFAAIFLIAGSTMFFLSKPKYER